MAVSSPRQRRRVQPDRLAASAAMVAHSPFVCIDSSDFDPRGLDALVESGAAVTPALVDVLCFPHHTHAACERSARVLRAIGALPPSQTQWLLERAAICEDDVRLRSMLSVLSTAIPEAGHRRLVMDLIATKLPSVSRATEIELVRFGIRFFAAHHAKDDRQVLLAMLASNNPLERQYAAERFGQRQDVDEETIVALERAALDLEQPRTARLECFVACAIEEPSLGPGVRDAAAIAIARLRPGSPRAIRGHELLVLRADRPMDRVIAAVALAERGAEAQGAARNLLAVLDDPDQRLVAQVITTLGAIGAGDRSVRRRLERFAASPDEELRTRANAALRRRE